MTRIAAVHGVLPAHRYGQRELAGAVAALRPDGGEVRALAERFFAGAGVEFRHLAFPLERYPELAGFGRANDAWLAAAAELAERAAGAALDEAQLPSFQVDFVVSTTVTGIAVPSLEARLAPRLGLRADVRRLPLFGLGCAGGAAGMAAVDGLLAGRPDGVALLLATELCSLTLQRADVSAANLLATALFGDGAGALVAVGDGVDCAGPEVVATRSRLYPGTERLLGWEVGDDGFRILLGAELPELVRLFVGEEVSSFLAAHDLKPGDVTAWVCHPGGPRVLDALEQELGLPEAALAPSRASLARCGNLSSASVLHILRDVLQADPPPPPGSYGLVLALGPGFASELVLLRW
ncbi:type III polyketide synthase [Kitasatospora cineracea]|uniref:Isopalmitoylresorcinol synthase n=1 Tax=Kitasatospora cineracea TaxID=88074 RepID=A0A8G1UJR0_9ACTN|nr:3-oxoacyl-[acyl-carrier-protein] synthase III C-terminal domain-containing protein [Kitasatospora cineracea]ROR45163.1 isopalmitoylresorcinol synthase [Kitasatospora cineracea]